MTEPEHIVVDLTNLPGSTVGAEPQVAACSAPDDGLFRVGWALNPLKASWGEENAGPRQGNRFDGTDFGVRYLGTTLEACFGEVLADFRVSPKLLALAKADATDQSLMQPGQIAAEWRTNRAQVHLQIDDGYEFLDVEAVETREFLRYELALGLSALGVDNLDVEVIRGPDRRVTRLIADWAFKQYDEDGLARYAGMRYLSKINTDWECWAVFDDVPFSDPVVTAIECTCSHLLKVSSLYHLHVH